VSSLLHQRVSRRPQLRSLLDQQRTLGNRAVLRLIGVEPRPLQPVEPPAPLEPRTEPPEPPPSHRRWFFGIGVIAVLAALEAAWRWFGG
jgi:hypothetical protein